MTLNAYAMEQQALATAWKTRTETLPNEARTASPWINHEGSPRGRYEYCLPPAYAERNLLPEVREGALKLFRDLGIPWHCGIDGGPGNHLLSSQVQCVNALYSMSHESDRIVGAFGHLVDIAEVLEIEPDRFLTFEFIGPEDYFDEGIGKARVRGTMCTSLDAAFLYRTSAGEIELALVEWKYTESYLAVRKENATYDQTRRRRYFADFEDVSCPLRSDVLAFEWLLDEPFYQLMRQQLLAHRLETDRVLGATKVRVLHVLSPKNAAYQGSLVRPEHRALGAAVDEVWSQLLRTPDRFIAVHPDTFLHEQVTSADYIDRYSTASRPPREGSSASALK